MIGIHRGLDLDAVSKHDKLGVPNVALEVQFRVSVIFHCNVCYRHSMSVTVTQCLLPSLNVLLPYTGTALQD
jgi:hypothetical protein